MKAKLFDNQLFVDDRGTFLNVPLDYPKFNFQGKRTYICQNFQSGTVRGFHYHKKEQKIFIQKYWRNLVKNILNLHFSNIFLPRIFVLPLSLITGKIK